VRNFVPAFFGRGVVQINAFIDQAIASTLPVGAVALLGYTQTLTMLPISLFGMSIAASELPEMSSSLGTDAEIGERIRGRINAGLRYVAVMVIPSAVGFMMLGDVIASALYRHGRFTAEDTTFTWGILAAAAIGLLASTMGRLYSSAFYALHDTRTPLRISILRVAMAAALGWTLARYGPPALGIDARWGAAALALSSSLVGWLELTLLRRRLSPRVGVTGVPVRFIITLLFAAVGAGATGFAVKRIAEGADLHRIIVAGLALGAFAVVYGGIAVIVGVPEVKDIARRLKLAR
jgi:putative peptidoglycan lipid II flippase